MNILEKHFQNIHKPDDVNLNLWYDHETKSYKMFSGKGLRRHINYLSFKRIVERMTFPATIIETGTASAGIASTLLFNNLVATYGGIVYSVDIDQETVRKAKVLCDASKIACADSVGYLHHLVEQHTFTHVDLIYFDSYDIDWQHPDNAAQHCWREFQAAVPLLAHGSMLLIDDTPCSPEWLDMRNEVYDELCKQKQEHPDTFRMPGKGMIIVQYLDESNMLIHGVLRPVKLWHEYQVCYVFLNLKEQHQETHASIFA